MIFLKVNENKLRFVLKYKTMYPEEICKPMREDLTSVDLV